MSWKAGKRSRERRDQLGWSGGSLFLWSLEQLAKFSLLPAQAPDGNGLSHFPGDLGNCLSPRGRPNLKLSQRTYSFRARSDLKEHPICDFHIIIPRKVR